METIITIAIFGGILASILLIAIGWRLVHALEEISQALAFLANTPARANDRLAAESLEADR